MINQKSRIQCSGRSLRPSDTPPRIAAARCSQLGKALFVLVLADGCGSSNSGNSSSTGGVSSVGGNTSIAGSFNGGSSGTSVGGSPGTSVGGASNSGGNTVGGSSMGGSTAGGTTSNAGATGSDVTLSATCSDCLTTNSFGNLLPPCETLQGNDAISGTPKKKLCKDVFNCVANNACFNQISYSALDCYCGTAKGTACQSTGAANGPCRQQIEAGLDSTEPGVIATNFGSTNYPGGLAVRLYNDAWNYCSDQCADLFGGMSNGTGGASGTGGTSGTGGASSTGGTTSTTAGGATSTGGSSATGGTSSRSCSDTGTPLFYFDTALDGFAVGTNNLSSVPTITFDPNAGSPSAGSAALTVPFSNWFQHADFVGTLPAAVNLDGKTLFICARLDSGLFPAPGDAGASTSGCAILQAKAYDASNNSLVSATNLCPGDTGWIQYTVSLATKTYTDTTTGVTTIQFDATKIASVGVFLQDSSSSQAATAATLHIDTIGYR